MRVGLGYDIHRTDPGRRLILGGVEFIGEPGLTGHSDADVVLHAIMDALLGAAGLSDIGTYFPPHDDRFAGISSLALLGSVAAIIHDAGYRVVNVDAVIVAERPRIAPRVADMRASIAGALAIEPTAVNIKATTNEGVGPEGRMEAIGAHAIALLETAR